MSPFTLDDTTRQRILDALADPSTAMSALGGVDIIAPLVLTHGEPALVAIAGALADHIIDSLFLHPGLDGPVTVNGGDGQPLTLDTAPPDALHQVLAYEFVTARLRGDDDRQLALARHLGDDGCTLCGGLAEAVRRHARTRADQ